MSEGSFHFRYPRPYRAMSAFQITRSLRAASPVSLAGLEGEHLSAARMWNRFAQRQHVAPRAGTNPFERLKNPETQAWWPAFYSARRQKKLALAALSLGKLDELPPGRKVELVRKSLSNPDLGQDRAPHASLLASQPTITEAQAESEAGLASASSAKATPSSTRAPKQRHRLHALAHAQALGPYRGRNLTKLFKGRKADKQSAERKVKVQAKMANMQESVAQWKQVSRALRPAAPSRTEHRSGARIKLGSSRDRLGGRHSAQELLNADLSLLLFFLHLSPPFTRASLKPSKRSGASCRSDAEDRIGTCQVDRDLVTPTQHATSYTSAFGLHMRRNSCSFTLV